MLFSFSLLVVSAAGEFLRAGGTVSASAIQNGFFETERQFAAVVREEFENSPHLATVGACSAMAIVTPSALWVANVGDCRVVLGQVGTVRLPWDGTPWVYQGSHRLRVLCHAYSNALSPVGGQRQGLHGHPESSLVF